MKEFLNFCFPNHSGLSLEKLKGDGGHRYYQRVKSQDHSYILMDCGPQDPSLKLFIEIQKRLKTRLFVPQIYHWDLKKGLLLLEDLGDESLESYFLKTKARYTVLHQKAYQQALEQLITMQTQIPLLQTDPSFDSAFFEKENHQALYDVEKYLKAEKKISPSPQLSKDFKDNMKELTQTFLDRDQVFCHRDYHSRNLMFYRGEICILDFQDAGKGPWFYDLASLLYDSYVFIEDKARWYEFYYQQAPAPLKQKLGSLDRVQQLTETLFLQRGFKACGRFCAFKTENGKDSHLKYLKSTFQLLNKIADKYSHQRISQYLQFLLSVC